jgi:hypothetical protein
MLSLVLLAALLPAGLSAEFSCPDEFEGYYPHATSCDKFYACKEGKAELETCDNGLAFADVDPTYTAKNCDYIHNIDCGNRTELEPAVSAPNCPRLYGIFPDESDCTGFYQCRDGISNRFSCAPGLAYDTKTRVCKWADQVNLLIHLSMSGENMNSKQAVFILDVVSYANENCIFIIDGAGQKITNSDARLRTRDYNICCFFITKCLNIYSFFIQGS